MPLAPHAPVSTLSGSSGSGAPGPLPSRRAARKAESRLRVSVIIPLYNHEKYIEAALDSVFSQSVRPDEIIVIDDGSVDASAEKLRRICQDHPEIIFWSWPNQGAHHTLNAAILRATGDFVAILNSDDSYHPQRLAACLAAIKADPSIDVVATAMRFIDNQGSEVANPWYEGAVRFFKQEGNLSLGLFNANFLVTTSNLFIRRSVFDTIGYFSPLRYAHDLELCLRLILGKRHIHFLDRPLLSYRLHQTNTIAENKAREDVERAAVFAFFLYRLELQEGSSDTWHAWLDRYIAVLEQQELLKLVGDFLALLKAKAPQVDVTATASLRLEFLGFLSQLGVDWVTPGSDDVLLTRFVEARKSVLRRQRRARRDPKFIAQLQADNEWLLEQRDAWEKSARDQEEHAKSLTLALEDQARRATQALEDHAKRSTQALEEQAAWFTKTLEDQAAASTQALQEMRAGNAWLLEQRDAWEKSARDQEELAQSLALTVEDFRAGNAWLESQRLAWEQVASEQARSIAEMNSRLYHFAENVAALESQRTEREQYIAELILQRTEREQYIAELIAERSQILSSLSWKLTRPLRYARRKLLTPLLDFLRRTYRRWPERSSPDSAVATLATAAKDLGVRHKTLLVLHEFSLTGAPRATLYLARALFAVSGIRPVVIAPSDGPIRAEFEQEGFPARVDPTLFEAQIASPENFALVSGFERVIVTPLAAFPFVRHFKGAAKRLTWWIHEEEKGFAYIADNFSSDLASLFDACDAVWLGSPLCFQPASHYAQREKLHLLLYGCDDISLPNRTDPSGHMVFTLVGSVEPRKGQDLFLDAIERLPPELRSKAVFRIIGSPYNDWSAGFHEKICARARLIPEVECIPNMPFQRLLEQYSATDVVVSASRADPMPISITQGLMFAKACLCSSAIGHAHLLEDGNDGLIFANESAAALADKMAWLLQNPDRLPMLGAAGRKVYEKHFLMTAFINNVSALLHDNDNSKDVAKTL